MMPSMDGFKFCEIIKKDDKTKDIKFILITSLDDVESKVKCFEVGADDYILKPFDNKEVLARINTHLSIKKLQDDLKIALSKIEKELEVVGAIQRNLLPDIPPKFPEIVFETYYNTFAKSGGDYFDFIKIDEKNEGVLIVDVSGHGTSSTVIMAMIKVFFTKILNNINNPSEVLTMLNNLILEMLNIDKFATVFYGILNRETMNFSYANAAHPEPFVINKATREVFRLKGYKGLPVGILPDASDSYKNNSFAFEKNSRVILYTDGITEAKGKDGVLFGFDRFTSILMDTLNDNITTAKCKIINTLLNYTENNFDDDITMVMFDIT
jgi:sigma-B regulation protein RsbU (phosphoserine phosphatase)